jgi:hypothetical protein
MLIRENLTNNATDFKNRRDLLQMNPALTRCYQYYHLNNVAKAINYAYKMINNEIFEMQDKKASGKIEIDQSLQEDLDDAYKYINGGAFWREYYFGSPVHYPLMADIETLKQIRENLANNAKDFNSRRIDILPARDCFQAQDFESFLTMGLPPEAEFRLNLDHNSDASNGTEWGMNAEGMLAQMHQITANGIPFDINVNNCSVTVGKVLEAGAKGAHLKSLFQNKVLGAIDTPQTIANNVQAYLQDSRESPKDNILKAIARWNPIEQTIGKQILTALSSDNNKEQQRSAWLKAGAIAVFASPLFFLKSLLTPRATFRNALNLIKFASTKDHAGFKAAAYVVGGIAMTVFAVPALIETVVKAPFKAIKWIADKIESRRIRKDSVHIDMSPEEVATRTQKDSEMKERLSNVDLNVVKIQSKDPKRAFQLAKKAMENGKIVYFEPKTRLKIEDYIKHVKEPHIKAELQQSYSDIVNHAAGKAAAVVKHANYERVTGESSDKRTKQDSIVKQTDQLKIEDNQSPNNRKKLIFGTVHPKTTSEKKVEVNYAEKSKSNSKTDSKSKLK